MHRIQTRAARINKIVNKFNKTTPLLKELYWLAIEQHFNFKITVLT